MKIIAAQKMLGRIFACSDITFSYYRLSAFSVLWQETYFNKSGREKGAAFLLAPISLSTMTGFLHFLCFGRGKTILISMESEGGVGFLLAPTSLSTMTGFLHFLCFGRENLF